MKIIFKFHFLFFITAFLCFLTGYFKSFIMITSIILFHELGHILVGLLLKWKIEKVIFFPFGGLTIFNQKINSSLIEEFLISISGIVFQVIYFLLINKNNIEFTYYHYFILIFNLIPIYPLDGSKICNIVFNKFFSFKFSYILTIIVSFLFIFILLFISIKNDFNLLFVFCILTLITKLFVYYKDLNIIFNKFLLERYIYKFKFKKRKIIKSNNLNKMSKSKNHLFITKNSIVKEEEILNKMFDTK